MVSCREEELLGTHVIDWTDDIEERTHRYKQYLREQELAGGRNVAVEVVSEDKFGGGYHLCVEPGRIDCPTERTTEDYADFYGSDRSGSADIDLYYDEEPYELHQQACEDDARSRERQSVRTKRD